MGLSWIHQPILVDLTFMFIYSMSWPLEYCAWFALSERKLIVMKNDAVQDSHIAKMQYQFLNSSSPPERHWPPAITVASSTAGTSNTNYFYVRVRWHVGDPTMVVECAAKHNNYVFLKYWDIYYYTVNLPQVLHNFLAMLQHLTFIRTPDTQAQ